MGTSTSRIPGRPVSRPPPRAAARLHRVRLITCLANAQRWDSGHHKREPRSQHVPRRSPVPLSPVATHLPGVTASGRYVRCGAVLQTGPGHLGSAEPWPVLT